MSAFGVEQVVGESEKLLRQREPLAGSSRIA
jgi:hypothetical protein